MESHYSIFLTHTPPPFSISVREKIMFLLVINGNLARARDWQSCQSCFLCKVVILKGECKNKYFKDDFGKLIIVLAVTTMTLINHQTSHWLWGVPKWWEKVGLMLGTLHFQTESNLLSDLNWLKNDRHCLVTIAIFLYS